MNLALQKVKISPYVRGQRGEAAPRLRTSGTRRTDGQHTSNDVYSKIEFGLDGSIM